MPAKTLKCFNYKISSDYYNKIVSDNILEWPKSATPFDKLCSFVLIKGLQSFKFKT